MTEGFVCCIVKYGFCCRYRGETEPVSVLKLFLRCPALVAANGILSSLVQCPAMCLVPEGGNVCPPVSCREPLGCRVKKQNKKQSLICSSVGTFSVQGVKSFYYKRSLKNTAPHLPWYAAYVILHERKLQIAFIMTYNA